MTSHPGPQAEAGQGVIPVSTAKGYDNGGPGCVSCWEPVRFSRVLMAILISGLDIQSRSNTHLSPALYSMGRARRSLRCCKFPLSSNLYI